MLGKPTQRGIVGAQRETHEHTAIRAHMPKSGLLSVDPGQAGAIVRIITQFFCPFDRW